MQFEPGYIYHIYNQGNNRQRIFFNRANYLYFLEKINVYIKPYADILASMNFCAFKIAQI